MLDFAGGTVVHISSGAAALRGGHRHRASLSAQPRTDVSAQHPADHSRRGACCGSGGSGSTRDRRSPRPGWRPRLSWRPISPRAAATLSWVLVEWKHHGKPTTLGAASGCVDGSGGDHAGVGIRGADGGPGRSGSWPGAVCYMAVQVKRPFNYDDALDVVGVHGVGGVIGALGDGSLRLAGDKRRGGERTGLWQCPL